MEPTSRSSREIRTVFSPLVSRTVVTERSIRSPNPCINPEGASTGCSSKTSAHTCAKLPKSKVQHIKAHAHNLWKMADILDGWEEEIRRRILRGDTLRNVSLFLQSALPGVRGLSIRSVRRFCQERRIHYRSHLRDDELDEVVRRCVLNVGHSYGRRSLHGLLRSRGIHVSQQRLGMSLRRTFPLSLFQRRRTMGRAINPIPYRATFYGEKLHMDQNEKLVMYGVVHVVAIDGYSRRIVGFATMPRKNPITIYATIMRPLLLAEGIWDQLRFDHGREFTLVTTVQEYLTQHRVHQE